MLKAGSIAIGNEYIIMEHVTGVQLHHMWPTMSGEQQIRCIQAITMNIKQMADYCASPENQLWKMTSAE